MSTADLETCRWCKGPHPIEQCPAVRFAFDPAYTGPYLQQQDDESPSEFARRRVDVHMQRKPIEAYRPNAKSLARLCAREGCNEPRHKKTPYCLPHRREVDAADRARRRIGQRQGQQVSA